jgi:hypothetical protein
MNAPNAIIKKRHCYPPFLSTGRKKWEDSAAQEMIPDDRESALEAAVGEALSN